MPALSTISAMGIPIEKPKITSTQKYLVLSYDNYDVKFTMKIPFKESKPGSLPEENQKVLSPEKNQSNIKSNVIYNNFFMFMNYLFDQQSGNKMNRPGPESIFKTKNFLIKSFTYLYFDEIKTQRKGG
jgi:hypothetical protein